MAPNTRSGNPESASPDPDQPAHTMQDSHITLLALQQVGQFHGKPSLQPTQFLLQLRHAFSLMGPKSDTEKINHAVSCFRDKAYQWVEPYLNRDPPPEWLLNFDRFAAELTRRFGKPGRSHNVSANLNNLKQMGSVADYATAFLQEATPLGWPDAPLKDYFYRGLKSAVRSEFSKTLAPADLESYIQMAINIDNYLQEQESEEPRPQTRTTAQSQKRFHPRGQPVPSTSIPPRGYAPPVARDSGTRPQARSTAQPRFRQLTDQEKEFRRKNNLCMYCGDPNHALPSCPQRPSNRHGPTRAFGAILAVPNLQGNVQAQQ
jgi:hypothetical protein